MAVALALQDTLGNLFAGVQIVLSRQVRPFDFVRISTGDEGRVIDVRARNTTIETGDGSPNSSGSSPAGNSGTVTIVSGPGGNASAGSAAGVSGNVLLKTGTGGGNASSNSTGGKAGDIDVLSLWAGQGAPLARRETTADLVQRLASETAAAQARR